VSGCSFAGIFFRHDEIKIYSKHIHLPILKTAQSC